MLKNDPNNGFLLDFGRKSEDPKDAVAGDEPEWGFVLLMWGKLTRNRGRYYVMCMHEVEARSKSTF